MISRGHVRQIPPLLFGLARLNFQVVRSGEVPVIHLKVWRAIAAVRPPNVLLRVLLPYNSLVLGAPPCLCTCKTNGSVGDLASLDRSIEHEGLLDILSQSTLLMNLPESVANAPLPTRCDPGSYIKACRQAQPISLPEILPNYVMHPTSTRL